MAGLNFPNAYEYDPYDYNGAGGGLPGRLWQPDALQPLGYPPGIQALPGGLFGLGLLLALQHQQHSSAGNNEQAPSEPQDPNFRQVSRAPIARRQQAAIDASNRSEDQAITSYLPRGDEPSWLGNTRAFAPGISASAARLASPSGNSDFAFNNPSASANGAVTSAAVGPQIAPRMDGGWPRVSGDRPVQPWPTILNYVDGDSSGDEYHECLRAAVGGPEAWSKFCSGLDSKRRNKVAGRQSAKQACYSQTFEKPEQKMNWCENQFGQ